MKIVVRRNGSFLEDTYDIQLPDEAKRKARKTLLYATLALGAASYVRFLFLGIDHIKATHKK